MSRSSRAAKTRALRSAVAGDELGAIGRLKRIDQGAPGDTLGHLGGHLCPALTCLCQLFALPRRLMKKSKDSPGATVMAVRTLQPRGEAAT